MSNTKLAVTDAPGLRLPLRFKPKVSDACYAIRDEFYVAL